MAGTSPAEKGAAARSSDLRRTLLDHAVALTRRDGPSAVSLREVQRLAGVSPAAAYRHYRDREALMVAVGRRASAAMADAISKAVARTPATGDACSDALARLRAGCLAYIGFVQEDPGLFRAVFLTDDEASGRRENDDASRGASGMTPYELLQAGLHGLAAAGAPGVPDAPWSATAIMAACHGQASLILDGPLRHLLPAQKEDATRRLLDMVLGGLVRHDRDDDPGPPPG